MLNIMGMIEMAKILVYNEVMGYTGKMNLGWDTWSRTWETGRSMPPQSETRAQKCYSRDISIQNKSISSLGSVQTMNLLEEDGAPEDEE